MQYILTEPEYDALKRTAEITLDLNHIIHFTNQKYKDPLMKQQEDCILIQSVRNGRSVTIRVTHDLVKFIATQLNPIDQKQPDNEKDT